MLFTPEMSGMIDRDRNRAAANIRREDDDLVLRTACDAAAREGIFVTLGSLAIKRDDGLWANRSFAIDSTGKIVARYDKMRSEEHTSELQSLMRISYAVFCLKKKTQNKQ